MSEKLKPSRCAFSVRNQNDEAPTSLRMSMKAWLKLIHMRNQTSNEVSVMGISSERDLLRVTDVALIKQSASWAHVAFDDAAVADFFDEQTGVEGREPQEFFRIWIHTHPGNSASPSGEDEDTFERVFGPCDWAVMLILGQDNSVYCRLWIAKLRLSVSLPVKVTLDSNELGTTADWTKEYEDKVQLPVYSTGPIHRTPSHSSGAYDNNIYGSHYGAGEHYLPEYYRNLPGADRVSYRDHGVKLNASLPVAPSLNQTEMNQADATEAARLHQIMMDNAAGITIPDQDKIWAAERLNSAGRSVDGINGAFEDYGVSLETVYMNDAAMLRLNNIVEAFEIQCLDQVHELDMKWASDMIISNYIQLAEEIEGGVSEVFNTQEDMDTFLSCLNDELDGIEIEANPNSSIQPEDWWENDGGIPPGHNFDYVD